MHTDNTQIYGAIQKAIGDALQSPSLLSHIAEEVIDRLEAVDDGVFLQMLKEAEKCDFVSEDVLAKALKE
jgi:hypothetical protein